ncbi:MAG: YeeE/YedE family protein [Alphaproteobacteria bacterium]|nr:YeeE/YedE family protein [Alphaproteobacteria bacterium]
MGAISDLVLMGDTRRLRAALLSVAVATIGSQLLDALGLADLSRSIYRTPALGWAGAIVGGGAFGFGMVLAGGCGSRILVRAGAGNLKSLVAVLVLAVTALTTLRGVLATIRRPFEQATQIDLRAIGVASQGLPDLLARASGLGSGVWRAALTLALGLGTAAWALSSPALRHDRALLAAAVLVGLIIPAAWAATSWGAADPFEPMQVAGLSFVAPTGEGLQYLMFFTGASLGFGAATVGGVLVGSFLAAAFSGQLRLEGFRDTPDLVRHIFGGMMMGAGGVLALGCTVGQGLSGLSTLALGSFIAVAAIVVGAVLALRWLEAGSLAGALRVLLGRA